MSIVKNYSYSVIFQVANFLTPFITTPYLARTLGPAAIGTFAYLNAVGTYFVFLGGFALSVVGNREIAKYRDDPEGRSKAFSRFFFLQLGASIIAVVLYIGLSAGPWITGNFWIKALIGAQIAFTFLDVSWYFMAQEEMRTVAFRNLGIKFSSLILVLTLVKSPDDLPIFVLIMVTAGIIGNGYCLYLALKDVRITRTLPREVLTEARKSLGIFWPQLIMMVYANADRIILGANARKEDVGYYDQGLKLIAILQALFTSLRPILIVKLTLGSRSMSTLELRHYHTRLFGVMGFIGAFLMGGVAGASGSFIPWFLGSRFEETARILPVLSVLLLVCSYGDLMVNQMMIALERERSILIILVVMFVQTILAYLVLIPRYGAIGAALSLTLANTSIMVLEWFFLRDVIDLPAVARCAGFDLAISLVTAAVLKAFSFVLAPSPLCTTIQILLAFIVFGGLQKLRGNPTQNQLISRLVAVFHKRFGKVGIA